jgi:hypothetical protein
MTEQQRPDEEVEGHAKNYLGDTEGSEASEDDVEGHKVLPDDVEGHSRRSDEGDDVEGHHVMWKQDEAASEDDVGGHGQRL